MEEKRRGHFLREHHITDFYCGKQSAGKRTEVYDAAAVFQTLECGDRFTEIPQFTVVVVFDNVAVVAGRPPHQLVAAAQWASRRRSARD